MKMVSAAKLKGDETRLALAKPFHAWTTNISDPRVHIETPADVTYSELPKKPSSSPSPPTRASAVASTPLSAVR